MNQNTLIWAICCLRCKMPIPIHIWDQPTVCEWCHTQLPSPKNFRHLLVYCPKCRQWNITKIEYVYDFVCPCHLREDGQKIYTKGKDFLFLDRYKLIEIVGKGLAELYGKQKIIEIQNEVS